MKGIGVVSWRKSLRGSLLLGQVAAQACSHYLLFAQMFIVRVQVCKKNKGDPAGCLTGVYGRAPLYPHVTTWTLLIAYCCCVAGQGAASQAQARAW